VNSNNYLIYLKNNLLVLHNNNRILAIQDFEKHIYDYYTYCDNNIKLLKSIACRFYSIRLRSLLIVTINKIILRLFDINIAWLTYNEYNLVPFNENTPIRITTILHGILLNLTNDIMHNTITETNYDIKLETIVNTNKEVECSICYNSLKINNCASFECKHEYCIDCTEQLIIKKHTDCPYCRNKIKNITCYNEESYNKLRNNLFI
jgi:hypothetical protein